MNFLIGINSFRDTCVDKLPSSLTGCSTLICGEARGAHVVLLCKDSGVTRSIESTVPDVIVRSNRLSRLQLGIAPTLVAMPQLW